MAQDKAQVTRWPKEEIPTEAEIRRMLAGEGLSAYRWSNGPGDVYSAHTHPYRKVIYVVQGSITFGLPDAQMDLQAGDRLDLPQGTRHDALVGPRGVVCLEAHHS